MDTAHSLLRAASPREEQQSGCQESKESGHQNLMGSSVSDHLLSEAEKLRPETWVPTARIAFIIRDGTELCQWWICIDEPRRGDGEWRTIPRLSRQEAEAEGPLAQ